MFRDGLGVARDLKKANMLFHAAAQQDLPEAQVNLGKFHFGESDFGIAALCFPFACRVGKRAKCLPSASRRHGRLCPRQHVL